MKKEYGLEDVLREYGELNFARTIRAERLSRDMTLQEFSEMLGISIPSLADLEKGRRTPSPRRAYDIAQKLGEPEAPWVKLALQDQLNKSGVDLTVSIS